MSDDLDRFYELAKIGARVDNFLQRYDALFPFIHSTGLTSEYRLGKSRLKRLRDEVTPAARFIRQHAAPDDQIQFPLNNSVPDCNVWHHASARNRTIEITIIQGRERLNLMTELNATGSGRGFLGLTDDRPTAEFLAAMGEERQMHSTDKAQATMAHAIALCAQNKTHSQADTLLIEVPLLPLPKIRWLEMQSQLTQLVQALSFSEIFLVWDHDDGDLCLQLK